MEIESSKNNNLDEAQKLAEKIMKYLILQID